MHSCVTRHWRWHLEENIHRGISPPLSLPPLHFPWRLVESKWHAGVIAIVIVIVLVVAIIRSYWSYRSRGSRRRSVRGVAVAVFAPAVAVAVRWF